MQQRMNLNELALEIQRQKEAKRDFIVPSGRLQMVLEQDKPRFEFPVNGGLERLAINPYAHGQIAGKLAIPKAYYDRMLEEKPDLLAHNVNSWLHAEGKANMVRTLDGNVRAFLSDRYRPIDHDIIAEATLPHLLRAGVQILSTEITSTRLYLQVVSPRVSAEIPSRKGQVIQAGLTISNSEVGAGSVWFASLLYFLACLNGQIGSTNFSKYHIGKRVGNQDGAQLVDFSDMTKRLDDRAFMSALNDMTASALNQLTLDTEIKMIEDSTRRTVGATALTDTVQEISKRYAITEKEQMGILTRIIQGADLTQFGIASAITNLANDQNIVPDFDRVIEMQKLGNEIMSMKDSAWEAVQKVRKDN